MIENTRVLPVLLIVILALALWAATTKGSAADAPGPAAGAELGASPVRDGSGGTATNRSGRNDWGGHHDDEEDEGDDEGDDEEDDGGNDVSGIPLEEARLFIEFNSTDNDLGFHVFLDGEDWNEMEIINPDGRVIAEVEGQGAFGDLGLTELFFEGAEPSLKDVPLDELLDLFPEGEYQFRGRTVDGEDIVGEDTLTHDVPDGPVILSPTEGQVVNKNNLTIRWKRVTSPPGIDIVGYEVIVGDSSLKVPASQRQVKVPPQILEPATEYEFEILAIEESGNQTITSSSFVTQ